MQASEKNADYITLSDIYDYIFMTTIKFRVSHLLRVVMYNVYCMYIICILYVYYMCITCVLYVYYVCVYIYIICVCVPVCSKRLSTTVPIPGLPRDEDIYLS
jgi:hypothetical protein